MLKIKNLRGECQYCGGPIEFHAEFTGTTADCPHCGQPTELLLSAPPDEGSPQRTKAIIFSIVALVILAGGLVGTVIALKRAQRIQAQHLELQPKAEVQQVVKPVDPFVSQGFRVSSVTLDKGQGNSLVYAVGTIGNTTQRQRFGVKVELELFDEAGNKLGAASDYQKVLEVNAEWKYRALVVEKRARSAKVGAIKEAP